MAAITTYGNLQARTSDDWSTLSDAGGFDAIVRGRPLGFVALAAGNVVVQGRSGNNATLTLTAFQFVDLSVTKFVASGSTLTNTQILLLY